MLTGKRNEFMDRLTYRDEEIPSQNRSIVYMVMLSVMIVLSEALKFGLGVYDNYAFLVLMIFLLWGVGAKHLRVTIRLVNGSWRKTFNVSLILFFLQTLLEIFGQSIQGVSDPQGIKTLHLQTNEMLFYVLQTPLIGIEEEFLKAVIFFGALGLIAVQGYKKVIGATFIASLLFGLIHAINWPVTAAIPIFFWAIPSFLFLTYYRSIVPLIIVHATGDALGFIRMWGEKGTEIIEMSGMLIFLLTFGLLIVDQVKSMKKKGRKPDRKKM